MQTIKEIIKENVQGEILLTHDTDLYGAIEINSIINGNRYYNGIIWGVDNLKYIEDGMITAEINGDKTAIMLHNVTKVTQEQTTKSVMKYIVNIEYK